MNRALSISATLLAVAAVALPAAAPARPKPQAESSGPQQINCDVVAANPSSGMDKASCEQMNAAAAAYYNAQNDPSGARPGDETMTCDQITAELMQQQYTPPSAQHVQAAQAATSDYMAKAGQLQGEAAAAATTITAEETAASAVGVVNPIAGRAAQQAVNAQAEATQAALNAQAKAELMPRAHNVMTSTGAIIGDATPQIASNPRLAHLMQLADKKHCKGG